MTILREIFGNSTHILDAHNPDRKLGIFLAGAELEIEDVRDHRAGSLAQIGIDIHSDGSLRNQGFEYILPPKPVTILEDFFTKIHNGEYVTYGMDAFSLRTSIHVHVNMQESTPEQTKKFINLYTIFENIFFNFVGDNRKNNIHCVPLTMTTMANLYHYSLPAMIESWHKYTAFNIIPLSTLGTIEFRHLYGTCNTPVFSEWMGLIQKLWSYAHDASTLLVDSGTINSKYLEAVRDDLLTDKFKALSINKDSYILEDNLLDFKICAMKGAV